MALKRRLTDQDIPLLRMIRRRTSLCAVKSVCVPVKKDNDVQSQTGSNDPVYPIDYDLEDEVESPVSHEDELKAIIPQLPAIIERQKQQEENAVCDYFENEQQRKQEQEVKQQYEVSQEDDDDDMIKCTIELEAEDEERLLARKQRHKDY